VVDFKTLKYEQTVIKNRVKLTYELADRLIKLTDKEAFLLEDRFPKDQELKLREKLQ